MTLDIKDEDFIDSVFFRFATNQLPLRQGETFVLIHHWWNMCSRGCWSVSELSNQQNVAKSIQKEQNNFRGCRFKEAGFKGNEKNQRGIEGFVEDCFIKYWRFANMEITIGKLIHFFLKDKIINYLQIYLAFYEKEFKSGIFRFQFPKFKFLDIKSQFHVQINSIYILVNLNTIWIKTLLYYFQNSL